MLFLLAAIAAAIVFWTAKAIVSRRSRTPEINYQTKMEFAVAEWIQSTDVDELKAITIDYGGVYKKLEGDMNYVERKRAYDEASSGKTKNELFKMLLQKVITEAKNQYGAKQHGHIDESTAPLEEKQGRKEESWEAVFRTDDEAEAQMVRDRLDKNSVATLIRINTGNYMFGPGRQSAGALGAGKYELLVPKQQAELALELINGQAPDRIVGLQQ